MPVAIETNPGDGSGRTTPPRAIKALSPTQERKLVDYLEDRFLDVTRNYKKRSVFPNLRAHAHHVD